MTTVRKNTGLYQALERDRANQVSVLRMTEDQKNRLWLLTLDEGASIPSARLA